MAKTVTGNVVEIKKPLFDLGYSVNQAWKATVRLEKPIQLNNKEIQTIVFVYDERWDMKIAVDDVLQLYFAQEDQFLDAILLPKKK